MLSHTVSVDLQEYSLSIVEYILKLSVAKQISITTVDLKF